MTVDAYYQNILPGHIVAPIQQYAQNAKRFERIRQDYMDKPFRNVDVHRVPNGHPIEEHIVKTIVYHNREYFQYDLAGTFEVQLMKYGPGDGFKWHCDYGLSEDSRYDRKLSFTLQLSHSWEYSGADVEIMDWFNRKNIVTRECGGFVVFDSRVPHRVKPLKEGERIAIVAWAHGPQLR